MALVAILFSMENTPVTRVLLNLNGVGYDSLLVHLSMQHVPSDIDGGIEPNNEPGNIFSRALHRMNMQKIMNKVVVSAPNSNGRSMNGLARLPGPLPGLWKARGKSA